MKKRYELLVASDPDALLMVQDLHHSCSGCGAEPVEKHQLFSEMLEHLKTKLAIYVCLDELKDEGKLKILYVDHRQVIVECDEDIARDLIADGILSELNYLNEYKEVLFSDMLEKN